VNTKILNGAADMDTYSTTEFPGLEGKLFEGQRTGTGAELTTDTSEFRKPQTVERCKAIQM